MGLFSWLFGRSAPPPADDEPLRPLDFSAHIGARNLKPAPRAAAPNTIRVTVTTKDDWIPPPAETVLRIVAPQLPARQWIHELGGHECLLEYQNADGRFLKRTIAMLDARNASYSVLIRAYTVGGEKSRVAEYRVHRMQSLTGRDGAKRRPIDYLSENFGLIIKAGADLEGEGRTDRLPLAGERVVFTGATTIISRADVRRIVEQAGGSIMGVVNSDTTILVVGGPDHISERKIAAAKKTRARILSEAEFVALVEVR